MSIRFWLQSTRSLIEEVVEHASIRRVRGSSDLKPRSLKLVTLEQRTMFSATPLGVDVLVADPDGQVDDQSADSFIPSEDTSGAESSISIDQTDDQAAFDSINDYTMNLATPAAETSSDTDQGQAGDSAVDSLTISRHELVIIDSVVGDYQQFIDDLVGNNQPGRNIEFVVLDSEQDIDDISQLISQYDDLDAIHIVSHGTAGQVKLGSEWLDINNVNAYAGQIASWRDALTGDADLLIYGCDLASNVDGRELIESLAALTGADVTASVDDTGSAERGGNWDLEFSVGSIEATVAFSDALQESWQGLLANARVLTGTYTGDGVDDRAITGLGFSPEVVIIKATNNETGVFRTSSMVGDTSKLFDNSNQAANLVQSLDADGFTIGNDNAVNSSSGWTYEWIAFDESPGFLHVGTYVGDGTDGRAITGVGFSPEAVLLVSNTDEANIKLSTMPGALATQLDNESGKTNRIVSLDADGFTVDKSGQSNGNGKTFYYVAWNAAPNYASVGTYTGDGTDDRNITGAGFSPDYVIVKGFDDNTDDPGTGYNAAQKTFASGAATDSSQFFGGTAGASNNIQALEADGFQVGTSNSTNAAGNTYYWLAFDDLSNTAPTLDASKSPTLLGENEDAGTPSGAVGALVSSLVDFASPAGQVDNITDPDAGALLGIALTAVDTTNGTWHYSTDGGTVWNAMGAVSDANARLLAADASTRLYFEPNANYNGTLASAITFRAWDQASGSNGGLADTSTNGGATAFSTATDTASLIVSAVNDAPTLTATADNPTFTEGRSPVGLYSSTSTNVIEAGDLVDTLTLTVAGLQNGADEILSVDGTDVALTHLNSVTTATNGYDVNVTVSGGTATVTITHTSNYTAAAAQTLVDGLTYENTSNNPLGASRTATLTYIKDDGGVANGGDDDTVLSIASTVTVIADNTAPTVAITRDDPNPTNATSVTFGVDFSEDVTGVDAADFLLNLSGVTANATVTVGNAGDADASTYTVTVDTIAGDGTLGLDIAGGNNIVDLATNAVNITPTTDEIYTIDTSAPAVAITRDDPNPTNATSVVFSVDFDEDVLNVDAADFVLDLAGVTANATVTVGNAGDADASTYTVTVDTIAGNGTLGLDIAGGTDITNLATVALITTPTTDELYTIDNTVPTVAITRDDANPTGATSVVFSVDFSEDVTGVDAADFALDLAGVTANATVTVGNAGDADASTYTVTVDTIAGDGTLGLDIAGGNNITDLATNAVNTTPTTDDVYTIDNTVPTVAIRRDDPNPTNATSVVFSVDFSEDVTGVDAADFTLALAGVTANATVTVGNAGDADASTYTVTVDTIAGDGTLGLDIAGGNNIADLATNAVNTTPTTDEFYTIDTIAPTVAITRDDANPTNSNTVVFSVDFSEDVTGVDATDFTLALAGVTANATVTVGNAGDADASTYTVTVDTIAGDGTLGLDVAGGNNITDLTTNAVNTTPTTDEIYTIDNTAPTVSITRDDANPTGANSVVFSVDFSEDVTNVDAADFTLALSGVTANATVTVGDAGDVDATTYTVTVDTIAGDGTLGLDLSGGNNITDLATNAVNTTPTTDQVYTIDNNQAPTDILPNSFSVNENVDTTGGLSLGTLTASDPDVGDTFSYAIRPGGDGALFTIGGAGVDELVLDDGLLDFETKSSYSVTVRVTDSGGLFYDETLTVNVNDLNDSPVAVGDASSVNEGATVNINLAANDTDADDGLDLTSLAVVSGPANGSLVVNANGTVDYTHNGSETTSDSFTYTIRDTSGAISNVATVSLTINPVNDAPVSVNDTATTDEDTPLVISAASLLANDTDAELDTLSIASFTQPVGGTVIDNLDGTFTYTPTADFNGADSFTYTAVDGNGGNATATVAITVNPVDDAPSSGEKDLLKKPDETPAETEPDEPPVDDDTDAAEDDAEVNEDTETSADDRQRDLAFRGGSQAASSSRDPSRAGTDVSAESGAVAAAVRDRLENSSLARFRNATMSADDQTIDTWYVADSFNNLAVYADALEANELAAPDWSRYWETTGSVEKELAQDSKEQLAVGTAAVVTTAVSLTYALWTIRGASLVASMMSSLPTWALIDPLPIVETVTASREAPTPKKKDDETLQDIVKPAPETPFTGA